jgi:hypothetical protein
MRARFLRQLTLAIVVCCEYIADKAFQTEDQCVLKTYLSDRLKAIGVRVKNVTRRVFCDILRGAATALSSISRLIFDTSSPLSAIAAALQAVHKKRASHFRPAISEERS